MIGRLLDDDLAVEAARDGEPAGPLREPPGLGLRDAASSGIERKLARPTGVAVLEAIVVSAQKTDPILDELMVGSAED